MSYFKINGVDYSDCVNALTVEKEANYSAQTNAAGNTVVDFINHKRTIEVGIIPLDGEKMAQLQSAIDGFEVTISFLNPSTNALEDVSCIIPDNEVEYYTIQAGKTMLNAFSLTFTEL